MLEPKVLKLLEMAEREELPDVYYPAISFGNSLISDGKLTELGKTQLSAHRYDTDAMRRRTLRSDFVFEKIRETPSQEPFATKEEHEQLTRDVGKLWSSLQSDLTALHAQLGELKYKVEKIESVVSPAHKCLCKQCNKS